METVPGSDLTRDVNRSHDSETTRTVPPAASQDPNPSRAADTSRRHSRTRMFLSLTDDDSDRLRDLRPLVQLRVDEIVERFYVHLRRFEETRRYVESAQMAERLRALQRDYLLQLFEGVFDEAYCQRRRDIGRVHHRIGLDPNWYIGAVQLYQSILFPMAADHLASSGRAADEVLPYLLAISRALIFDMGIALEAYSEALHQQILSEKEQFAILTTKLQESNAALAELTGRLEHEVRDRTSALFESQERLVQSEKMAAIGKMASQMAHEIRNPLSSVILNLELLSDELDALDGSHVDEARALPPSVLQEAGKMNDTIRDYLNMGRMPQVRLERVDLPPLIRQQMGFLWPELRQARVTAYLDLADVPPVMADAEQFRRVLLNLVRNSLDAMADGGELRVACSRQDDGLVIRVADSGAGIPLSVRDQIFQPLFTTKEKGLGMGLSYVREVVHAHGGTIECEDGNGAGATFRIVLPCPKEADDDA